MVHGKMVLAVLYDFFFFWETRPEGQGVLYDLISGRWVTAV